MAAPGKHAVAAAPAEYKMTRFAADLFDAATVEGARQSRSARQQLDHWARVGRAVSSASTAQRARVEAALAGEVPITELSPELRTVVHAEIAAGLEERITEVHIGAVLGNEGITTVALDDNGNLVEYRPDGTTSIVTGS